MAKLDPKRLDDLTSSLCSAFQRIQNPGRGSQKPYITRKQIIKAYEAFTRNRGRSEWEHEAVSKALMNDPSPVSHPMPNYSASLKLMTGLLQSANPVPSAYFK